MEANCLGTGPIFCRFSTPPRRGVAISDIRSVPNSAAFDLSPIPGPFRLETGPITWLLDLNFPKFSGAPYWRQVRCLLFTWLLAP
jgi:hypothetical protein